MAPVTRFAILQPGRRASLARLARSIADAAGRADLESRVFSTSDVMSAYEPDFVLALDPEEGKLTRFPTYGLLTLPWLDYQAPRLLRNVLSFDAYLTPSERVRQWIEDVSFGVRKLSPVEFFAPSAPLVLPHAEDQQRRLLACVPDECQADDLFTCLSARPYCRFLPEAPADPRALVAECGVGLSIDQPGACADGQPSIALFETVASGAVAITTRNVFTEQWFGDAVLYVDGEAPPEVIAWQIDRHMSWIAAHPREANALAVRAGAIVSSQLSLERGLLSLFALHERVLREKRYRPAPSAGTSSLPRVTYIVRTAGAPERILESLRHQNYPNLNVILVPVGRSTDVSTALAACSDLPATVIPAPDGCRSASLWAGLRAVAASNTDLFGMVGDSDELFPNHVRTLVSTLDRLDDRSWFGSFGLAYSGTVERARGIFAGDRLRAGPEPACPVTRRMRHFRFYHPARLDDGAHEVYPGAFLARRALLDDELLVDPELDEGVESYLELLLAEKTPFAFSCEVTAMTYDQSDDEERDDPDATAGDTRRRTFFRTYGRLFPAAASYQQHGPLMTEFDRDLLAPVVLARHVRPGLGERAQNLDPVGGAVAVASSVRVSGSTGSGACARRVRLPFRRCRIRCYFATADLAGNTLPFELALYSSETRTTAAVATLVTIGRTMQAHVAEFDVESPQAVSMGPVDVCVDANGRAAFDLLSVRLDRLPSILKCSIFDLPPDKPVWLYGAGEGGRQARRRLQTSGVSVAGFVDRFKTGTVDGLPILDLDTATRTFEPDTALVISSMFWEQIRADIERAGLVTALYRYFPPSGDTLHALN